MNKFVIISWQIRHGLRTVLPHRGVRLGVIIGITVAELMFVVYSLRQPWDARQTVSWGIVTGFIALNLLLALSAACAALVEILRSPERLELTRISPIPNGFALYLAFAPAIAAAAAPLILLSAPLIARAAYYFPVLALSTLLAGICAFGWALTIAALIAGLLAHCVGAERGAELLKAGSATLGIGTLIGFRALVGIGAGFTPIAVFIAVTALGLPICWRIATRYFVAIHRGYDDDDSVEEPRWGKPCWGRLLRRTVSGPAILAVLPPTVVAFAIPSLRYIIFGTLILALGTAPLQKLLSPEFACPARLILAPNGARMRCQLITKVGAIVVALSMSVAAVLGWGHWMWILLVGGASIGMQGMFFAPVRTVRSLIQLLFLVGASVGAAFEGMR